MAEPDTAVRAAPSDNLAQVAALLRKPSNSSLSAPGSTIHQAAERAERLVFMSDQLGS